MKIGEYWGHKENPEEIIELMEYVGNDLWGCRHMFDGCDDDLTGKDIYNNYKPLFGTELLEVLYGKDIHNKYKPIS
jgi:hypothetical protein